MKKNEYYNDRVIMMRIHTRPVRAIIMHVYTYLILSNSIYRDKELVGIFSNSKISKTGSNVRKFNNYV